MAAPEIEKAGPPGGTALPVRVPPPARGARIAAVAMGGMGVVMAMEPVPEEPPVPAEVAVARARVGRPLAPRPVGL